MIRPLALDTAVITTYLFRLESSNSSAFAGAIYRPSPGPFERLTQRTAPLKIGHRHEDCVPLHLISSAALMLGAAEIFSINAAWACAPHARSCPYASELYQPWTRIHPERLPAPSGQHAPLGRRPVPAGFIGGCARGGLVERCASASPEASINRPNLTTLKISLLAHGGFLIRSLCGGSHARHDATSQFSFSNFRLAIAPGVPSSHLSALLCVAACGRAGSHHFVS